MDVTRNLNGQELPECLTFGDRVIVSCKNRYLTSDMLSAYVLTVIF